MQDPNILLAILSNAEGKLESRMLGNLQVRFGGEGSETWYGNIRRRTALTPQYLASRAVAARDDALSYTLARLPDPWWREVILLEAGYLSGESKQRVSDLIQAIMDADPATEPQPYHHLILAAECLYDVGAARIVGDLLGQAKRRLQAELDKPLEAIRGKRELVLRRVAAANALSQIESGRFGPAVARYWKPPWGEPEWIEIPAGEFWMGGEGKYDGKPVHRLHLPTYAIARVPVTNAQYALYVADQNVKPPKHWSGGQPPKGLENHPVVYVTWRDAMAYCTWLSRKTGKAITLPSEAEWEKAARGGVVETQHGASRQHVASLYPWGDAFDPIHCNTQELGLEGTSPVGFFLSGASPYGCLDMSGNVWEWTRSIYKNYPYDPADGRENQEAGDNLERVLRGGSWRNDASAARCAYRGGYSLYDWNDDYGFRILVSPISPPQRATRSPMNDADKRRNKRER